MLSRDKLINCLILNIILSIIKTILMNKLSFLLNALNNYFLLL